MFDFKNRLRGGASAINARDRLAVFESLDRRASHTTLRDTQREALQELSAAQEKRDVVLKLSTGGGKTTIALVHLYAYMLAAKRPCLYVCPRRQLVNQVLQEAKALGIPAIEYPPDQRQPANEAVRGEALLVCTYDKMFNGKSTFTRSDVRLVPHAIVLDDAHAGLEEVRDCFTLRIPMGTPLHEATMQALQPARQYNPTKWIFIDRQDPSAILEVPFWIWAGIAAAVTAAIEEHADEVPFKFVWPHLRERLRWCRCFVSGDSIEIGATVPFVDDFLPFSGAEHRLFMSATLADDSALVREFGCERDAAALPVIPKSDAGVGERMIIAPTLVDAKLTVQWVREWSKAMAQFWRVVVICPSEARAREWAPYGAHVAIGEDVDRAVDGLRQGTIPFVAFAQRYDGVDLPDDTCRFLVLDGIPQASGLAERQDSTGSLRTGIAIRPTVHRLEQGMGRAVRSHVDYAVVVLGGEDLATFISHRDIEAQMGAATRAQIQLAHQLASIARERLGSSNPEQVVHELALACLRRDLGWKQFYDEQVRQVSRQAKEAIDVGAIDRAAAERSAINAALRGDSIRAVDLLRPALNLTKDSAEIGRLMERLAGMLWEHDQDAALKAQRSAHDANTHVATPPTGSTPRRGSSATQPQATNVIRWYANFTKPGAALAEVVALQTRLSFAARAKAFEGAFRDLGDVLGALSSRPEEEHDRGPDNLWDWAPVAWVVEAKNERGLLPKSDGEQSLAAMQWFRENYPERSGVPVVVCSVTDCEWDAVFPDETRVLTDEGLGRLMANLFNFVRDLTQMDPQDESSARRVAELLTQHRLGQPQMLNEYAKKLGRVARR